MNETRKKNNLFAILFRYLALGIHTVTAITTIRAAAATPEIERERKRKKVQLNPEPWCVRHQSNVQYHPHSFRVIGGSA